MPRDLFGNVTRPSISIGSRKWYTLPVSLISHSAIVLLLVAIPILAPAVMPTVLAGNDVVTIVDLVPPPPPPLPKKVDTLRPVEQPDAAPTVAPDKIAPEVAVDRDPVAPPVPGIIGGSIDSNVQLAPPPEPRPVKAPEPVRVGGTIRNPIKVFNVDPIYPPMAQAAGVQGIVIIEATIGEDGRVINARILRSKPLLDQAALAAVQQWRFTPTMLNGQPVPVIMTVTVHFTLNR
jgi:protein TonB